MNKLDAMGAFSSVCQLGSFSAAAKQRKTSTTMISRQVRQLESSLGCLLLKRNTRKVSLTDAGEDYYRQIQPVLKQLSTIELTMSQYQEEPSGTLRLSTSIEFGSQYLAPLIALYRLRYPSVQLDVNLSNEPLDLLENSVDLVFRIAPELPDSSYIAQSICSTKLALWASPDYLRQHGKPTGIDDLKSHQLLFFNHSVRSDQWIFPGEKKSFHQKFHWAWRSNNGRLLNEAAAAGQGIIQAPGYSVRSYVEDKLLVEVLPELSFARMKIYAIYPHRYELSIRVKTFVELAKEYFTQNPIEL